MWIWYVSRSGGSAEAIAQTARAYGIEHVLVKSGDGTSAWSQFTPELVATLKAAGIKVCGWQFVYGQKPGLEAAVGAEAAFRGADCLVIDAESHYEGRYRAADRYMRTLRALVGPAYPIGLTSFPYVHYHPGFPYSVFLGRGGAQFNLPQVYWRTIGDSVKRASNLTYRFNRVYKRPIYPLGQTYLDPPLAEIAQFRQRAFFLGSTGVSWWSWQETSTAEWETIAAPLAVASGRRPRLRYPRLHRGSRGDLVVQAQLLLRAAKRKVPVTGVFSKRTAGAVRKFQRAKRLRATGAINGATWKRLLRREPKPVRWSARKKRKGRGSAVSAAAPPGREPLSARLPAVRYEIPQ